MIIELHATILESPINRRAQRREINGRERKSRNKMMDAPPAFRQMAADVIDFNASLE